MCTYFTLQLKLNSALTLNAPIQTWRQSHGLVFSHFEWLPAVVALRRQASTHSFPFGIGAIRKVVHTQLVAEAGAILRVYEADVLSEVILAGVVLLGVLVDLFMQLLEMLKHGLQMRFVMVNELTHRIGRQAVLCRDARSRKSTTGCV